MEQQQEQNSSASQAENPPSPSAAAAQKCETLDQLGRFFRDLKPEHSAGALLRLVRPLSQNFQTSHAITIPEDVSDGNYSFGATYVGDILPNQDPNLIMNCEVSPSSIFNGVLIRRFNDNFLGRLNGAFVHGKWVSSNAVCEYATEKRSLSLIVDGLNPFVPRGAVCLQYLQRVKSNLTLGFDFAVFSDGMKNFSARPALVAHSTIKNTKILANFAPLHFPLLTLNLAKDFDDIVENAQTTVFSEIVLGAPPRELSIEDRDKQINPLNLSGSIGYSLKFKNTGCGFKSLIKSDGKLIAAAEYQIPGLPLMFGLSSALDHPKKSFNVGFRVVFGQ